MADDKKPIKEEKLDKVSGGYEMPPSPSPVPHKIVDPTPIKHLQPTPGSGPKPD